MTSPSHPISLFLVLHYTITKAEDVKSSLSITSCHDYEITPSTAYTEVCIFRRLTVSPSHAVSQLSSISGPCCTQLSASPQLQVNQWIESQLQSCLPPDLLSADWYTPSTPPILIDRGLLVHLQSCSIMASKIPQSGPPSAPPNWLDRNVHVRTIMAVQIHPQNSLNMASKCISEFTRSGIQVHLQLCWSLRPSASLSSLNHGLQVHLQTCLIMSCKYVSMLTQSWSGETV